LGILIGVSASTLLAGDPKKDIPTILAFIALVASWSHL
jgi:hypothetical protein